MKHLFQFLLLGLGVSLFAGCGGNKVSEHERSRTSTKSNETFSRINLLRIYSVGALTDYFTSIDFGIEKYFPFSSGAHECRILQPMTDELRSRSPSPAHLYMNKTEAEVKDGKGNTDAEEVFFPGDNDNRNGREDNHEWTQIPSQEYLQFRKVWQITHGEYRFYVSFDLGGYKFKGNVQVKTWANAEGCETGAYLCTEVDEQGRCTSEDWSLRIESLTVHITAWKYPWGNYISKLEATPFGGGPNIVLGKSQ